MQNVYGKNASRKGIPFCEIVEDVCSGFYGEGKNTLRRTDGLNVRDVVVTFKSGLKECIQNCSGGSGLGYIRLWILLWKDLWRLRIVAMV